VLGFDTGKARGFKDTLCWPCVPNNISMEKPAAVAGPAPSSSISISCSMMRPPAGRIS
jgi:hypothetical protein